MPDHKQTFKGVCAPCSREGWVSEADLQIEIDLCTICGCCPEHCPCNDGEPDD